jgi:microsomal dipeptidase-like Zn-dependent dipeptidase
MILRSALLAALLAGAATAASAQSIRLDPHEDLPKSALAPGWTGLNDPTSQFDLTRAKRGGLTAAAFAVFAPQGAADAAQQFEAKDRAIHALADRNPAQAGFARSPADVRRIVASGRFAVIESILNAAAVGDDLSAFDRWQARGVSIVGFVHAGHNQFADSSRPALQLGDGPLRHGGLSPLGKAAVARLNDLGILIDVSQLSDAAFDQVLALSRAPVIASHSDVRALVDTGRNLSDAQLDALAAKGGVIGINAFSAYLRPRSAATLAAVEAVRRRYGLPTADGKPLPADRQAAYDHDYHEVVGREPKATLDDLLNAIDYAVKRVGVDHVAISTDFNHGGGVTGWADVGETAAVTAGLKARGYAAGDVEKLWGGNVLRVWQAALDGTKRR